MIYPENDITINDDDTDETKEDKQRIIRLHFYLKKSSNNIWKGLINGFNDISFIHGLVSYVNYVIYNKH